MEIEGEDGSRVEVGSFSRAVLGRGSGLTTNERTVSRRHVIFELGDQADPREVSFQVVGKNPVWVRRSGEESGREVEVFRRLEKGVLASGDWFCISTQNPVWFRLKERTGVEVEEENFDISKFDPVKEFGFLVIGHEFDSYPVRKIKDARSWNWFLEEPQQDSEDDESSESKKKSGRGKRKKKVGSRKGEDDDDWTGESEDDKQLVAKTRKVDGPKYSTRSTEGKKPRKNTERKKISAMKSSLTDEEDETLGGFIVDDGDEEQGEESDEEEEFADEDEDDDDG